MLIDREKLLKAVREPSIYDINEPDFISLINEQPTVNAVEVVRCRDCKHLLIFGRYPVCLRDENLVDEPPYVELQDFCSYGEKTGG